LFIFHDLINIEYRPKSKFERFCAEAIGKYSSGDIYQAWMQQLQQISGISEPVAWAIASKYPTVRSLSQVYDQTNLTIAQKEMVLANIPIPNRNKIVGERTSKKVYQIFTEEIPDTVAM